jgi:hypothetical protein
MVRTFQQATFGVLDALLVITGIGEAEVSDTFL